MSLACKLDEGFKDRLKWKLQKGVQESIEIEFDGFEFLSDEEKVFKDFEQSR